MGYDSEIDVAEPLDGIVNECVVLAEFERVEMEGPIGNRGSKRRTNCLQRIDVAPCEDDALQCWLQTLDDRLRNVRSGTHHENVLWASESVVHARPIGVVGAGSVKSGTDFRWVEAVSDPSMMLIVEPAKRLRWPP